MLRVSRAGVLTGMLAVLLTALGACDSGPDTSAPLPSAHAVLDKAAATTADLTSARFTLKVNGTLEGINVRSAKGVLARRDDGDVAARGTAEVNQLGETVELAFVLVGSKFYVKGPTGGFTEAPAALATSVYDPSALLNEQQGIANALRELRKAKTEGRETLGDVETYRVRGVLPAKVVKPLLPGINSQVEAKFWVRDNRTRDPVRAWFQLPPRKEGAGARMIEVALSELNKPVDIQPPG